MRRVGEVAAAGAFWQQIARFVCATNMPITTAASEDFRSLLQSAFEEGFQRAFENPHADSQAEFKKFCPSRKATAFRTSLLAVAAEDRDKELAKLRESPYVAMTMDAGTIGSSKLLVTNLVSAHPPCCLTYGIHQVGDMDHDDMRKFLEGELGKLASAKITISAITCDGARYQTKAIDFKDHESLQYVNRQDLLLSRVLYVPCLCHRLNNAYHALFRESGLFQFLIKKLRALAVFCRKPAQKKRLHRTCPQFIETRWVYDQRLLLFILAHAATINQWHNLAFRFPPELDGIKDLLQIFMGLVTALDGSHAHLHVAYVVITRAIQRLVQSAQQFVADNPDMAELYRHAADLIRVYTLESTFDLFQLAYVLSPEGRYTAFEQGLTRDTTDETARAAFHLPMVDFPGQMTDHGRNEDFGEEEEDPLADEAAPREGHEPPPEEDEELNREEIPDSHFQVGPARCPCTFLPGRARAGLDYILLQFRLGQSEKTAIQSAFQTFIGTADSELQLSRHLQGDRYCWLQGRAEWPEIAGLADIAMRLEPAICSEAPSERTIGQQRRFLAPFRMRTKPDLLLARTQMEDVRHRGGTGETPK
jgi:hypothetical protein